MHIKHGIVIFSISINRLYTLYIEQCIMYVHCIMYNAAPGRLSPKFRMTFY